MNVEYLRRYCLSFPTAKENLQWGETLCFKVCEKIFVTLSLESVPQRICFKTSAETFAELLEVEGITPAPYVGRYKWVMLARLDILPEAELEALIQNSYEMVASKLPRTAPRAKPAKPTKTNRQTRKAHT